MGAGKSAVINKLKELGYNCVDEPARIILAEQRKVNGEGVPEINPGLFTELMLEKTIAEYNTYLNETSIIFFDRGLVDLIAYAQLFEIKEDLFLKAANEYRFNQNVFFFGGWKEIYTTEDERKMGFKEADKFGKNVRLVYEKLGYNIHNAPFVDVNERVEFILNNISY